MITVKDIHNPSFVLFPINNNRTAWKDFGLPVILVVPHKRINDIQLSNSNILSFRIFIEDVPSEALVTGHDNIGIRYPDREIYSKTISISDLLDRQIDVQDFLIDDVINYTTASGVSESLQFIDNADYYDLSDILIEVELLPPDIYNLVYEAEYFRRAVTTESLNEFICIDVSQIAISRYKFILNHPGDIINEFHNLTPSPYLTNNRKSEDTTLSLYRPFTDILQDVYDETKLLENINWLDNILPESISYSSYLLGWDIPYFPASLDSLRKTVLRKTVEFQNISGSERAIENIFRLFGLDIIITNLWWSSDGKILIRPGQQLPEQYSTEEIAIYTECTTEFLLRDYDVKGFSEFDINLLNRPRTRTYSGAYVLEQNESDVTVESYLVDKNSDAYLKLIEFSESIDQSSDCYTDFNGNQGNLSLSVLMQGVNVKGYSRVTLGKFGTVEHSSFAGQQPLTIQDLRLNRTTNTLHLGTNISIDENETIFSFAIYNTQRYDVPESIRNLQSNRFDLKITSKGLDEYIDPDTLEFSLGFLNRLKAFHSLVNAIVTDVNLNETYEVTDWCVGGDVTMRFDVDAGMLQVPPAIIPNVPDALQDCSLLDPYSLGYKESDILLRLRKLSNLAEEHDAWKSLDSRINDTSDGLRFQIMPKNGGLSCLFTYHGQDKVQSERSEESDIIYNPTPYSSQLLSSVKESNQLTPVDDVIEGTYDIVGPNTSSNNNSELYSSFIRNYTKTRSSYCEDDSSDFCYKGRVDDESLIRTSISISDNLRNNPCNISYGSGVYYTYPSRSKMIVPGAINSTSVKTLKPVFSGNVSEGNILGFLNSDIGPLLEVGYDQKTSKINDSYLGRLLRSYGVPESETLHYSNRIEISDLGQTQNLAIQRSSLDIEKTNLHLPGCRFPTMDKLKNDFEHPIYYARPWDSRYSTYCGPADSCGRTPSFLNALIVEDVNGDEKLQFDTVKYSLVSNNMTPDIESYGDQNILPNFTSADVVHSIYSSQNDSIYVESDQISGIDTNTSSGFIYDHEKIFNSHNSCGTGTIDFVDGYPSERGYFDIEQEIFHYEEVLSEIGFPFGDSTFSEALYKYGSGILTPNELTLRYDCNCLSANCNEDENENACVEQYIDEFGNYDWDNAQFKTESRYSMNEEAEILSLKFDGQIPTFLEIT